ncbi:MAG: hypothetical protein ABSE51_21990 [Terracidiphilus sp.]|jgi:hypothetical protein
MHQSCELFGLRLAGKQDDLAAVACALRRCNAFVELKPDALPLDKLEEPVALVAYFAGDLVIELRKVCALGLLSKTKTLRNPISLGVCRS